MTQLAAALAFCLLLLLTNQPVVGAELDIKRVGPSSQVELTVTGGTERWHRLEVTTNLVAWSALTNLYQTNAACAWIDPESTNAAGRFYRSLQLTALDLYVAAPDTNTSYRLVSTLPGTGQTTYVLELVSQAWLTTNEVNRPLWKHWLIIVIPTGVFDSRSLLFISSGNNGGSAPTSADPILRQIATDTRTVVSELKMVPNQPLQFAGEISSRTEDSLIAYSWDKFLRTGDDRWPARLPMTKAAVRAMDAVTRFCLGEEGQSRLTVDRFVVAGASKRGWATWTTAAVDKRVIAIIPIVIDVLNLEPSFGHHYSAYGSWSPAIQDYVNMGIMNWFGTPEMRALMLIEDPYEYRQRLTMPKFLINASGDEFFLPDSAQFYFQELPGVKYLRYVPNASHSLSGSDAWITAEACYQAVLASRVLPLLSWSLTASNVLRVTTSEAPAEARLWRATNPNARDFRLAVIGAQWQSSLLSSPGGGVYEGTVPVPAQGWTAFFVELTYVNNGFAPLKLTTQVYVVPDILPYHFPP